MRIRERAGTSPQLANTLHELARLYYVRDEYSTALITAQRALAVLHTRGDRATDWQRLDAVHRSMLSHKGRVDSSVGRPSQDTHGPREHRKLEPFRLAELIANGLTQQARVAETIAAIQRARGDHNAALAALRAADGYAQRAGAKSVSRNIVETEAGVYRDMGDVYLDRRQYRLAAQAYTQSLSVWQRVGVHVHADMVLALTRLGGAYVREGKREPARMLLHRAQAVQNQLSTKRADNDLRVKAAVALLQAQLQHGEQSLQLARASYRQALAAYEQRLGGQHPDVTNTILQLALVHHQHGDGARALQLLAHAERIRGNTVDHLLATGAAREKRRLMASLRADIDTLLSVGLQRHEPEAHTLMASTLLRYKGRVLDAMSAGLASLRGHSDVRSASLLLDYQAVRSQYATQLLRGPEARSADRHAHLLAGLRRRVDELEAAISARSDAFSARRRPIDIAAVQAELDERTALIEWVRYHHLQGAEPAVAHYSACIITAHRHPACLRLGPAAAIDELAVRMHRAASAQLPEFQTLAQQLDALVLAPLLPQLTDVQRLLLAPDGPLHLAPLAALLDDEQRALIERYEITFITSGRELLRSRHKEAPRAPMVVLADPDYGAGRGNLAQLSGTRTEADFLSEAIPGAIVFTDDRASEQLLTSLRGPQILHIATHGYQAPSPCPGLTGQPGEPLLDVGLALANANLCRPEPKRGHDGLISAYELAALDLQGTQLAVLSACDSGIGQDQIDIGNERMALMGEGLYSLRRALMLAGARTQLVTLWKVDDRGTRHVMQAYYRQLLAGVGRSEALRRVQLDLLQRGLAPFYWAGFIVSGEDGPIDLPSDSAGGQPSPPRSPSARGCACATAALHPAPDAEAIFWLLCIFLVVLSRCRCHGRDQKELPCHASTPP